jgi:hypothetical protein
MKIFRILSKLPYFIQTIPYYLALYSTKFSYPDSNLEIWPRNSFKLSNIICALSDLDLTFYYKGPNDLDSILRKYKILKFYFPFLGEINFYRSTEIYSFLRFSNHFETQRDPTLFSRFSKNLRAPDQYQKIVFFLKLLEADFSGLTFYAKYRQKKWKHHKSLLEISDNRPISIKELINSLKSLLESLDINTGNFINDFFENDPRIEQNIDQLYCQTSEKRPFLLTYPFRWIGSSFYHQNFQEELKIIQELSQKESLLLLEQVRWEIWGLYTQHEQILEKENLFQHIQNIKILVESLKNIDHSEVLQGLNSLEKLCHQPIAP